MASAKVKEGNVKLTISLPESTNVQIRPYCMKQGDLSRIVNEGLNLWLQQKPQKPQEPQAKPTPKPEPEEEQVSSQVTVVIPKKQER